MNNNDGNSILSIRDYGRLHESPRRCVLEIFKQIVAINRHCRIAAINLEQREPFNNHVVGCWPP